MDLNSVSIHDYVKEQINTCQYPAILTSSLANGPYMYITGIWDLELRLTDAGDNKLALQNICYWQTRCKTERKLLTLVIDFNNIW